MRTLVFVVALSAAFNDILCQETAEHDAILERLARVALLYRSEALSFSCDEKITWTSREFGHGSEGFKYVLVHDEQSGFKDYRRRGRYRPKSPESNIISPDSVGVPRWLSIPYLWVFIFREERQPFHNYKINGKETVLGRPTIKIKFEPREPYQPDINEWFGTAWVDLETTQLVRVEAYLPEDYQRLLDAQDSEKEWQRTLAIPFIEMITTEFGEEKNGMRFPSKVDIRQAPVWAIEKHRSFESAPRLGMHVTQTFYDYQFFNVRTEEEIRAVVERKAKTAEGVQRK